MDKETQRRLKALTPHQPIPAQERARIVEVLRKHGADPEAALDDDGNLVADGDTHQYIAVLKAAFELSETTDTSA